VCVTRKKGELVVSVGWSLEKDNNRERTPNCMAYLALLEGFLRPYSEEKYFVK
jgi:hypothetical protein